ncbi:hypothetical protein TNCV_2896001 [Trichonephila clavipes]|nr:hypothetical protein TNCV_2896001 [Trichonephila clavipes]
MKEGRFVLGTFRYERMRVLYRSRQNDRLRMMLVLVPIDITPPQLYGTDIASLERDPGVFSVLGVYCNRDEAHFWLNGYVNKQKCRIWSEANPQVYVETPLHPEKLTVWCALWAGGILLQK